MSVIIEQSFPGLGINLKSAAGTLIVPAYTGKKFLPRAALIHIKTASGTGFTTFSAKLGNGGAFDIAASQAFGSITFAGVADTWLEMALNGSARKFAMDIGSTGISFTVTVASNISVAHTADVYLEGYAVS